MERHNSHEAVCIEAKDISFRYGQVPVLENVSFKVHKGDYLGIIGPNGGGKTTLLKIMLGLLKPQSGTVTYHHKNVNGLKDRTFFGYVPQRLSQSAAQFPATVEEIVRGGRTAKVGMLRKLTGEDFKKVEWAMEIADVITLRHQLIGNLSGGQRQKVFIARALAGEPHILFLDEPTVAVDVVSSQKFYAFLGELNKKMGLTIIFVSHDIDCVAQEVNSVLCLNRTLICHGSPKDFMKEEYMEKLYGKKIKFIMHGHE